MFEWELKEFAKKIKISVDKAYQIQSKILQHKKEENIKGLLKYLIDKKCFKDGVYYIPPSLHKYFKVRLGEELPQDKLVLDNKSLEMSLQTLNKFM